MNASNIVSRALAVVTVASASFVFAGPASAQTATDNLAVKATVTKNCIIATTAVDFGNYDPIATNLTADLTGSGEVAVTCTKGMPARVDLAQGANFLANRRLGSGTDFLTYELYKDTGFANIWKTGASDGLAVTGATDSTPRKFTVYGKIPAAQFVAQGDYTDSVIATINF